MKQSATRQALLKTKSCNNRKKQRQIVIRSSWMWSWPRNRSVFKSSYLSVLTNYQPKELVSGTDKIRLRIKLNWLKWKRFKANRVSRGPNILKKIYWTCWAPIHSLPTNHSNHLLRRKNLFRVQFQPFSRNQAQQLRQLFQATKMWRMLVSSISMRTGAIKIMYLQRR